MSPYASASSPAAVPELSTRRFKDAYRSRNCACTDSAAPVISGNDTGCNAR